MSYKEFVPTAQSGSSFPSHDNSMSPTLGKYLERNSEPLPYWSPATRRGEENVEEYSSITAIVESVNTSQLAPSATEFVPSGVSSQSSGMFRMQSVNGLNLQAAAWIPPTANSQSVNHQQGEGLEVYGEVQGADNEGDIEPMVEVTWNGSTFFVPESTAYAYEGGMGYPSTLEDDAGLEWAQGSTTLPCPPKRSLQTIGIPEPIRQHFQSLDVEALRQMAPEDDRYKEIPPRYHSAFVLDDASAVKGTGGSFGYPATLFKVVDRSDSQIYALRRLENVRTSPSVIKNALGKWFEIRHPSIVSLYSISQERGALFFTHAYHPAAQTLKQRFIDQRGPLLNESLMWRVLTQLLSGLRVVHAKNMAMRVISPLHVLLTSGTVVRFNNVGITDVLEFESRKTLTELQIDDLVKLGYLILSLAARAMVGPKNVDQAVLLLQQHFSPDMQHAVTTLLSGKAAASQVCLLISDRINEEFDSAMAASDALHSHLRNEYENGRMLRLLIKMGFLNERPEYSRAPQWSETGDRYVLKLFRDYMFHQALTDGAPVLDAGHVVTALNKLDCGDPEQMLLSSRDNKDLLVVSFTDVRRCLESGFMDLDQQAEQAQQKQSSLAQGLGQGPGQGQGHMQGQTQAADQYQSSRGYQSNPTAAGAGTGYPSPSQGGNLPGGRGGLVTYPLPSSGSSSNLKNTSAAFTPAGGRGAGQGARAAYAQSGQAPPADFSYPQQGHFTSYGAAGMPQPQYMGQQGQGQGQGAGAYSTQQGQGQYTSQQSYY